MNVAGGVLQLSVLCVTLCVCLAVNYDSGFVIDKDVKTAVMVLIPSLIVEIGRQLASRKGSAGN